MAVALWRCRRAVAVFKRHAAAATRHVHIGVRIAQRAQRVIEWSSGDVDSIRFDAEAVAFFAAEAMGSNRATAFFTTDRHINIGVHLAQVLFS